jgi:hypothetical protein
MARRRCSECSCAARRYRCGSDVDVELNSEILCARIREICRLTNSEV